MHRNGVIHRDIKPENILIADLKKLRIVIADLGLACREEDDLEKINKCGTPGYVAPEVLNGNAFSTKADIFSAGALFYNLITGLNLFRGANAKEILAYNQYDNA
jgi:serine/threonine protein kinase